MNRSAAAAALLACLRACPELGAGRVPPLPAAPPWPEVVELARAHGLLPLLRHAFDHVAPVPDEIWDAVDEHAAATAELNRVLTAELLRLTERFAAAAVRAVPFKGPALAAEIYGDVGRRQFGDLDILVDKATVERAGEVLVAAGYRPLVSLSAASRAVLLDSHYAAGYGRRLSPLFLDAHVEVHWACTPRWLSLPLSLAELGGRLTRRPLLAGEVLALAPEDS